MERAHRVRFKKETLQAVLEQCQRTLDLLSTDPDVADGVSSSSGQEVDNDHHRSLPPQQADREADENEDFWKERAELEFITLANLTYDHVLRLCELLKSRFECPDFLKKLEYAQVSVPQTITEGSSWDMVNEKDLWEAESTDWEQDDYVLVKQEDIVDGIACFMAAYLFSLKQTKDLTQNQLQEVLGKTFSMRKKEGKLQKAWDGSKVIYNVASWGATAIGIYENPLLLRVASRAFWTSCDVKSKFI